MMKLSLFAAWLLVLFTVSSEAKQVHKLREFVKSRRPWDSTRDSHWEDLQSKRERSPVYIGPQEGLMQADKISSLPGEPDGVDFDQYAGYVTVDPDAGRALFYYFVESPQNSSTNPLVLWLNGGPGCSSLGFGAMEELGPFRVNSDGKTLYRNSYAWNNVANVIFLESPAGVGFSYSNTSSDYDRNGDTSTAEDAYTFLVNWLERFPQYKSRDFYITGESYSGHYVPQLAYTVLLNNNNNTNNTTINLKGIAIGNALIDDQAWISGIYEYVWTHALISDETHKGIATYCGDFTNMTSAEQCEDFTEKADNEQGDIDWYNIYAPLCHGNRLAGSVDEYDPCSDDYVFSYLNTPEVQKAFHANPVNWEACGGPYNGSDTPSTVLPIIKTLMDSDLRVWIYSGDVDSVVPVTSTRYSINTFNLPVKNAWRPWYTNKEVGGYVETYEEGLTFLTVRGAGHEVPSYQPERALTMISSFLQGTLPPSSR